MELNGTTIATTKPNLMKNFSMVGKGASVKKHLFSSFSTSCKVIQLSAAIMSMNARRAWQGPRRPLLDPPRARADSKSHHGFGDGWRVAIASNAVMSCITACIPARIDRNPASLSRFIAAVRSVAIAPAPLPR